MATATTKGTRLERLDRLNARLFERENYAWDGTRTMDILRIRHVKVMAARRALLEPAREHGDWWML